MRFDFNNLFSDSVGPKHGVTSSDIKRYRSIASARHEHLKSILNNEASRVSLGLEWTTLPFQDKIFIQRIQELGNDIAGKFENVISLGIGGSYLGLKAAHDALVEPYYNDFASARKGRPRIYFEGNNLDPAPLGTLLENLDPRKTFVIVISKSGETLETSAAFEVTLSWLKKGVKNYGRHVLAITDSMSGSLRALANIENEKDEQSFRSLAVLKGVGGRFSELNVGLLHLALARIDISEVLRGAASMSRRCSQKDLFSNPAYLYAMLQTILYKKCGKSISIMMPFAETLKSTAEWYCQLLAESIGKKYARKVFVQKDKETWMEDKRRLINVGRTPVASRGTSDLHSIQQNNIEGENNKTVTFIKVEEFSKDIRTPDTGDFLKKKRYSRLLALAEEATEWALTREERPNCAIVIHKMNPYNWGGLIYFFEMATAFEGELLNINAFDQPGVEGYKNYMYCKLRKPGLAPEIAQMVKERPLVKKARYIL